jgi:hypothetical protein
MMIHHEEPFELNIFVKRERERKKKEASTTSA